MAISIDNLTVLQTYLNGVLGRADHHAQNVEGVALTLIGAILWRSNGDIEVREYNGNPANMIWFNINNKRYVLNFNHSTWVIDLKERNNNGNLIASFDNNSTYQNIIDIFKNL